VVDGSGEADDRAPVKHIQKQRDCDQGSFAARNLDADIDGNGFLLRLLSLLVVLTATPI